MPRWQQRLLAPQIKAWSLLGPPVSWAQDRERGVLLANPSGRFEVYAFDASSRPAQLRQVTDRPQGTVGCAIAPDGSIYYVVINFFLDYKGPADINVVSSHDRGVSWQTTLVDRHAALRPHGLHLVVVTKHVPGLPV